ncbi:MAG: ribonuclease HI [Candidatus Cryptobacteroides sp.]|nr:ribonuclease HI [Candidatus Cryptobacteroides sp.]
MNSERPPIYLYTDGSSRGNPGPGGYGVVLVCGNLRREMSEGFALTTNNRMELLAVIRGLRAIKWTGAQVHVVSDSSYVVNAINKGWIRSWQQRGFAKVKNVDLWLQLIPLLNMHSVVFHWIKGHAGHPENERCDQMAVAAALGANLSEDSGYEGE